MSELPMEVWVPLAEVYPLLAERMMVNGSNWILGEWKCKYIDARIDMRTGSVYLCAGNLHRQAEASQSEADPNARQR